jgi:hypothetical protein
MMKTLFAPGQAGDWGDGDCSYAANYLCFAPYRLSNGAFTFPPTAPFSNNPDTVWDAKSSLAGSFNDGTSNTIMFAEKYARCDMGGESGSWWLRGVYRAGNSTDNASAAQADSYWGDGFSAVFGGGNDRGGNPFWPSGTNSMFQIQPKNPQSVASAGGTCNPGLASTSHQLMQVALGDGGVRSVAGTIKLPTWAALLTPRDGDKIGPDWGP